MRALTLLFIMALSYVIQGFPSHIVDGDDVLINKYPYQASIRHYGSHICGGSVINNNYVLTAKQCFVELRIDTLNYLKVHVGTNFLNTNGNLYDVAGIKNHEHYDIALIYLKTSITYDISVQPISLMTSDKNLEGNPCMLPGWGSSMAGRSPMNNLKETELIVYPQEKCEEKRSEIPKFATYALLCTLTREGKEACNGDIGGPLVFNGIQIGIVSFSCEVGYPDVYTRVSSFIPWIFANIEN